MYEARDYETRIWWSKEDDLFVAQCVELPGVMSHGGTREAAAKAIQEAIEVSLEVAEEGHFEVPPPGRLQAA